MKLKKSFLIASLWVSTLCIGGGFMLLAGFFLYLSPKLPSVESIREIRLETPLRVYTADGMLIGEFGERRRYPIKYEDIPRDFINALIAAEDEDFYTHNGVSIKGLLRAAAQLVTTGRKGSGGSTLTMQLTRHVFLSLQRTFSRKFNEILLALRIEKELSKEEILELYVNLMFLGKRAYGIQAAAEVYYGKTIDQLSLAQHAMLVGVFKGPSVLNPISNPEGALERRNYVLGRMLKLKHISEEQYLSAIAEPVTARYHGSNIEVEASYVAEMARKEAVDRFGEAAYTNGYTVITTVKSRLQKRAQEAVTAGLLAYDTRHGFRGPEQQLSILEVPQRGEETNSSTENGDTALPERDYTAWIKALEAIPDFGGLSPAAVAHIEEQRVQVLLKTGDLVAVEWENGLAQARPYLTENARGPAPESASDVVQLGDIVRVRQNAEGHWILSQIPAIQASLISLNPHNGAVIALVGGFDFYHSNFNRAVQALRQPGSNFKPFIYTAALESGLTAASVLNDAPIVIADKQLESTWRPENSSKKFYGPTRLRTALTKSRNLVSVRVLDRIGVGNAIKTLEKFGFDAALLPKDLSLALGTHATTPLDVARGYAIFANGGFRISPYVVQRIRDFEGNIIYEAMPATACPSCKQVDTEASQTIAGALAEELARREQAPETLDDGYELSGDPFELSVRVKSTLGLLSAEDYPPAPRVISEQVAYIMDSMLKDVVRHGTAFNAWKRFKRSDLAGKTGTTNGPMDAWFSGYHPHNVTSVWLGFDQNTPIGRQEYGSTAALPIWMDFMELALADLPLVIKEQPEGIVSALIDPETGKRVKVGTPDAIFEIFRVDHVPELEDETSETPWGSEETINEELF